MYRVALVIVFAIVFLAPTASFAKYFLVAGYNVSCGAGSSQVGLYKDAGTSNYTTICRTDDHKGIAQPDYEQTSFGTGYTGVANPLFNKGGGRSGNVAQGGTAATGGSGQFGGGAGGAGGGGSGGSSGVGP